MTSESTNLTQIVLKRTVFLIVSICIGDAILRRGVLLGEEAQSV
jgi:hypothetical protein